MPKTSCNRNLLFCSNSSRAVCGPHTVSEAAYLACPLSLSLPHSSAVYRWFPRAISLAACRDGAANKQTSVPSISCCCCCYLQRRHQANLLAVKSRRNNWKWQQIWSNTEKRARTVYTVHVSWAKANTQHTSTHPHRHAHTWGSQVNLQLWAKTSSETGNENCWQLHKQ